LGAPPTWSCGNHPDVSHSDQIVGRQGQDEVPINLRRATMPCLAQVTHGLDPTESLLDALAYAPAYLIALMLGSPSVDGRTAVTLDVLGDMGSDLKPKSPTKSLVS